MPADRSKIIPVERALGLSGIPRAFRADPLRAEEMSFYAPSLNEHRGKYVQRRLRDDLLDSAGLGYFRGVIFGNRGTGKSTEINRLLDSPNVKQRFLAIRLDATTDLNPQTFSVADVLLLICIRLIEEAQKRCRASRRAFNESSTIISDLESQFAPYFPELQAKEQRTDTTRSTAEVSILQMLKLGIRIEGQKKLDLAGRRESLTGLTETITRIVSIVNERLPECELLIIGENFDKQQVPQRLLEDTFVQYSSVLRDLLLHLLFTLPVPFVHAFGDRLPFRRENHYPIYDVPVFTRDHRPDADGCGAVMEVVAKRAEVGSIFEDAAVDVLIRASGGDLYLLFALINKAGRIAQYRHEDDPQTELKVLRSDAELVIREQLATFRNEMGTVPSDADPTTWETKRDRLRAIYDEKPSANVPDEALYQLLRRRAVLYCNGTGRYGVHPLAVELLKEQLQSDSTFEYRGGGLDLSQ